MMKKKVTLSFVLLTFVLLNTENNVSFDNQLTKESKANPVSFYSSVSLGIISYANLGISRTKLTKKFTKEIHYILHSGSYFKSIAKEPYIYGLYIKTNYFKNPEKKGSYFYFDIGLDQYYVSHSQSWFSGAETGEKKYILPNIAFGVGYSFHIGKNSFFRISGDFGIKMVLFNLNIEYVF